MKPTHLTVLATFHHHHTIPENTNFVKRKAYLAPSFGGSSSKVGSPTGWASDKSGRVYQGGRITWQARKWREQLSPSRNNPWPQWPKNLP